MVLQVFIFLIGLAVLSWSADRFVYGASALAKNIGVSPMMIGLTIVAMGSSAPEIVVSVTASLSGSPDTAVGNAIGSNITNIALVLGITALIKPLQVSSGTLKREFPLLFAMCLLAVYVLHDQMLTFHEGAFLIGMFFVVLAGMGWLSVYVEKGDKLADDNESEIPTGVSTSVAVLWVLVGLVMLPLSAHFLVESAVFIAKYFGISDLVIGLTIIALGTSLPELAACIAGVLKGEDDLAMGNIIGSNIFNILAVLGMPGLIAPGLIDPAAATRDMYVMLGLTVMLLVFSFNFVGTRRINRVEASILLASFIGYQFLLFA
ncbi:MAG TPA: calcium/sodium antiporter [Glaciecola sp.]|nr:calcium/sodium antiporter [Glaciecola sp.]